MAAAKDSMAERSRAESSGLARISSAENGLAEGFRVTEASDTTFADMTVFRRTSASQVVFAGIDAPQRAQEGIVGPGFFELLGTRPLIGRTFSDAEFDRGDRVVVLSEGLWQSQFARSPHALGRTLSIAGESYTVVGVMPHAFQLPTPDTRFWRPLSTLPLWRSAQQVRDGDSFEVIGRLEAVIGTVTRRHG